MSTNLPQRPAPSHPNPLQTAHGRPPNFGGTGFPQVFSTSASMSCFSPMVWPLMNSRLLSRSLQLEYEVHHLPNVMMQVGRTLQNHIEPVAGVRTHCRIFL